MGEENDPTGLPSRLQRRKYLRALAAGVAMPALAGCGGDGGDGGDGGSGGSGGGGSDGGSGGGGGSGGDGGSGDGGDTPAAPEFELSFLTWNIGYHENAINGWMDDFTAIDRYSDVEMNWVDRPGSDFPSYLQTRIQGGNPPHAVDTQAGIFSRYASAGVFAPLDPIIEEEVEGGMDAIEEKFGEQILNFSSVDGTLYRLPFYHSTTWTGYRKSFFEEAGVEPPTVENPYTTFDYFDVAEEVVANSSAEMGLMMLTFGFHFWPLFQTEGVDLLNDDNTAAALNTETTVEILSRIQELTQDGIIAETSFTGRWTAPNQTFAAGNTAMNFAHFNNLRTIMANGDWINVDTLGVGPGPRNSGVYAAHGWGITSEEYHPTEQVRTAFHFINDVVLSEKWQKENATAGPTRPVANLNAHRDLADSEEFRSNNPILAKQYDLWSQNRDNAWAPPTIPASAEIEVIIDKDMVSACALGEKTPEEAAADAEEAINQAIGN
jgi:ABC-type glycerol-3-phosphate transport system substrate-binding protein